LKYHLSDIKNVSKLTSCFSSGLIPLEQRFSTGGARRDFFGCELLCQIAAKFLLPTQFKSLCLISCFWYFCDYWCQRWWYKKQYIKWCKRCKNDFSFRTGSGLQNELRTAVLEYIKGFKPVPSSTRGRLWWA